MPHRPNIPWQLWLVKSKRLDLEVNSSNGPKCTVLVFIKMRSFSFDPFWSHPPAAYLNSRNRGSILSPSLPVSFEVEGGGENADWGMRRGIGVEKAPGVCLLCYRSWFWPCHSCCRGLFYCSYSFSKLQFLVALSFLILFFLNHHYFRDSLIFMIIAWLRWSGIVFSCFIFLGNLGLSVKQCDFAGIGR